MWELACVGAGLPAIASPRSGWTTAVPASRASPAPTQTRLPHSFCVRAKNRARTILNNCS